MVLSVAKQLERAGAKSHLKELKKAKKELFAQRAGRELYEFEGVKYRPDELVNVTRFSPASARPLTGLVPKVAESKRIAKVEARPTVFKGKANTVTSAQQAKNKLIIDTLEEMDTKSLQRLTIKEMENHPKIGRNASGARKKILRDRVGAEKAAKLQLGRPYKLYDEMDNPVSTSQFAKQFDTLSEENSIKMSALFRAIDAFTDKGVYSIPNLRDQIGRTIYYGKVDGIPEDAVIEHIIRQMDNSEWGKLISKRAKQNPEIARAIEAGILKESDRPQISHEIPAVADWTKGMDVKNVFYGPESLNKAARSNIQPRIDDYLGTLGKRTEEGFKHHDPLMDRYSLAEGGMVDGYAGGGILKKLLGKNLGQMSRRKFLKGMGATAAHAALPRVMAEPAKAVAKKAAFDFAPPWISQMATSLETAVKYKKPVKLPNGTVIEYLKKPHTEYDSHKLAVKTVDGNEDLVNYKARKNGDEVEIEFDIRDEGNNNQHIFLDRKNKVAELVDENYYMTSPEDFAKDDPIIWDVSKTSIRSEISDTATADISKRAMDKSIILDASTKADDYIYDYMSMPEGSDYNYMWERYVDSFSPAGNIFKTKEYARQIRKQEAHQKKLREERAMEREMDRMDHWEEQFRGGHGTHGYKDGGLTKTVPPTSGPEPDFVSEGIAMINSNPQRFVAGGLVKRYAPKVLGKKSMYKPQITERKLGKGPDLSRVRTDLYEAPPGPYTITDEHGNMIGGTFKTLDETKAAMEKLGALRTQDPLNFKIFGARPPKTKEGVHEAAPTVDLGMVGKPLPKKKEEPPASMFWGSREKIINAPYEVMTGKQWLRFLKGFDEEQVFADTKKAESVLMALRQEGKVISKNFGDKMKLHKGDRRNPDVMDAVKMHKAHQIKVKKANDDLARLKLAEREGAGKEVHERILTLRSAQKEFPPIRDMELNDTGLSTHLSRNSSKMMTKEQLVKDFDSKLAPEIEVVALGKTGNEGEKFYNQMSKLDMDAYREGPIKNVLTGIRNRAYPLREAISNNNNDAILKIIDEIDNLTFDNFGVANAIKEGFPQKFPFELKKVLQDIAQSTGVRTAGFKKYARNVQYEGQQTLGGGENYREFLFRYKHPAGSLRETEPMKRYEELSSARHFSTLSDKDQMGGFVHTRVSDRTDEYGRRILHIEEIQSDLHQKVNAAARRVRKAELEGKKPKASDIKESQYAPRGDMIQEPIDLANEQQMQLVLSKIEDLSSMPQTKQTQIRIERLNKERAKIRKIIEDKRAKMSEGKHSGFAMGPLSKSEDYNEFVMKYLTKVAQEGGYDGVTISSGAIKNRSESMGSIDWKGNLVAYGPIAEGAMKRVAKKSGAKYLKTSIIDNHGRGWSVPMIWLDNAGVKFNVQKGMPIYKKGGMVVNG